MKIENQVKALLLQHDCVIVPGFGAFLAQYKTAAFDSSNHEFRPPYKEISFNASLKNSDGLLLSEVKNVHHLSYDQALELIQNQVNFWKEHLHAGKELVLDKIGTIKLNDINALEFTPNQQNFLLSSYGLPAVKATYILETENEESTKKPLTGLLAAASFLPILIGGFLYFNTPQPVQSFVDEQWSGIVLPMFGKEKIVVTNVLLEEKIIDHLPVLDKKDEVKTTENNQTFVVKTTTATKNYQVVAGSFRRLDEAERAIQNLREKGYQNAGMVYKKGSYFYVNYNAFDNEQQAREFLNQIHETDKEAWIRTN